MHELSLAGSILRIVEDAARRERFARVTRLTLRVGRLSGVGVDALRFALGVLAGGTCIEGADIRIEEPPGRALCLDCDRLTAIEARGEPCARCGGWRLRPVEGTELRVVDILVEDA
ncbi:MAG: hydrogenase maturation nickel metallochaperone HypA [Burkholderiales bacterium]|nr:MAG: hydrogenase maturation nickel metallochaperone HypA [Burkholderiales bacterium]